MEYQIGISEILLTNISVNEMVSGSGFLLEIEDGSEVMTDEVIITINELAKLLIEEYRNISPNKYTGKITVKTQKDFYGSGYEDIPVRVPDIQEAEKLLDWKPVVGIEDAVRKTLVSFVDAFEELK